MHIIALLFTLILLPAASAVACMGPMSEDTIFFEKMPEPMPDADVVAKVKITSIKEEGIHAIASAIIIEASKGAYKAGDTIEMQYVFSSCGPNQRIGNEGVILAQRVPDEMGKSVLAPFLRRYGDGHITQPRIH